MQYALSIVVPYRDRAEHLSKFIPHMLSFFSSENDNLGGRVLLQIVQQEQGREFNRGALKNIGFARAREISAATCFNDIDFLPLDADYRPPGGGWISLLKGGFTQIYEDEIVIKQPEGVFGGVIIFANADFQRMNGFSNSYWGWGFEDVDMAMRSFLEEVPFSRRPGNFEMLTHRNGGFERTEGGAIGLTDAHTVNRGIFNARFPQGADTETRRKTSRYREDGLSSLDFKVVHLKKASEYSTKYLDLEIVTISL